MGHTKVKPFASRLKLGPVITAQFWIWRFYLSISILGIRFNQVVTLLVAWSLDFKHCKFFIFILKFFELLYFDVVGIRLQDVVGVCSEWRCDISKQNFAVHLIRILKLIHSALTDFLVVEHYFVGVQGKIVA